MLPRKYNKTVIFLANKGNARRTRLDDVDLAKLDTRLLKAQAKGDDVPKGLAQAVTDEVAIQSAEALSPENRLREPGRALLWMMHLQERETLLMAQQDQRASA